MEVTDPTPPDRSHHVPLRTAIEGASRIGTLVGTWALLSAFLYLYSFWSTFNVNIFQFIGVSDLLIAAAIPLTTIVVAIGFHLLLFGPGYAEVSASEATRATLIATPIFEKPVQTPPVKWWVVILNVMGIGVLAYVLQDLSGVAYYGAGILACAIAWQVGKVPHLKEWFPEPYGRYAILLVLALVPVEAVTHGQIKANTFLHGSGSYSFICDAVNGEPPGKAEPCEELRFIGKASSYFFFLNKGCDKTIQIRQIASDPFEFQFRPSPPQDGSPLLRWITSIVSIGGSPIPVGPRDCSAAASQEARERG